MSELAAALQALTVDSSPEFDQTHWIPKSREGVPLSDPMFDPLFNTPQICSDCGGNVEHPDGQHGRGCGRFVHVVDVTDAIERREFNPFEVRATGSAEPLAVTTSIEAARAALRLLR
jgi:hypothetical protein